MRDLSLDLRSIRGKVITNLAELQEFLYEIPEKQTPPDVLTKLVAGSEVDPVELYEALDDDGRRVAGDSDAAIVFVEVLRRRLRAAFPDELADTLRASAARED